jgi:PAS domain S-box-containing protein
MTTITPAPVRERAGTTTAAAPEIKAHANHRILIVDDSESIHHDFRKILSSDAVEASFDAEEAAVFGLGAARASRARFSLDFAFQGEEALELVRKAVDDGNRYAAVFTDMRMPPGWDGLETTKHLWQVDPDIQIVICTAYSDYSWEEITEATSSPERLLILKKPFDTIEILQLAHALTEKWSLLQASRFNTAALEKAVYERTRDLQGVNVLLNEEIIERNRAEKAARRAEREQRGLAVELASEKARLLAAQKVAKLGNWEIDLRTEARTWSDETYRILEIAPESGASHQRFLDAVHPDDLLAVEAAFRASYHDHSPCAKEHRLLMRDGRVKCVEQRWHVTHDEEGTPLRAIGTIQDITERNEAHVALQKEREFLAALVENVSDGIVSCDAAGVITLFNGATREFHGLPAEPISSDKWAEHFDIFTADGKTLMTQEQVPLFRALSEGSVRDAEMVIAPRDGTLRRIVASGRAFFNDRGEKLGAVVAMHDVTEAKEAEEKLSRSHQLMEAVTEGTTDAIFAKDREGRYVMINTAGAAFFGRTPAEIIGHCDSAFFTGETLARITHRDGEILANGEMRTDETVTTAGDITRTFLTLKGALRNRAGEIVGVAGYSRDISASKAAEIALRQSEAELRTLVESIPQIVWIAQPDGQHVHFNQQWLDYTGLSMEESLGDGWIPAFHPDDRARTAERWQRAIETGETYEIEYRLRRSDGLYHWMLGRALPLRDGAGAIVKWFGTLTDIEELKQAEQVAQQNAQEQRELAAQLDVERDRLVAAQTVAKVGDWDFDMIAKTRSWSAETYRIFEIDPAQSGPSRERFMEIVHPEDRAAVCAAAEASLLKASPCLQTHRLLMSDGRIKFVDQRWQVFHDENGAAVRAAGTIQDVTDHARAQERLRESATALSLAQQVARLGSWELDLDELGNLNSNALRWSDETFRILGLAPGEIEVTNAAFFERVHPDDREQVAAGVKNLVDKGTPYDLDHRIELPDGTVRVVHEQATLIFDEHSKRPTKIAGTVHDITERKATEETLREQAEMLNLAHDAIVIRRFDDRVITFWNHGAERLYGWTAAEAVGRRIDDLLFSDTAHYESVAVASENNGYRGEVHQVAKDGRQLIVNARATVIRDPDGSPRAILIIQTDVTEHKKLESQFLRAQRLESIGTLASGVAHDLNNVLAPILMSAPLLRDELPPKLKAKIIDTVENSAERGAQIVKQVLTFARGVDGERVLLDPRHLIKEMADIAEQTFPKNIQVTTRYAEEIDLIEGDPTQLHQVLLNLAVNARDAMPSGGKLVLSVENFEVDEHYAAMTPGTSAGPHILLSVSDTGHGIPAEIMEKMFDPFFTTKELGKGTGLGLSTLLGIVKSHTGAVNAYSTPSGTTFRVLVPAAAGQDQLRSREGKTELPRGQGEIVLVVDDEPAIREMAEVLLTRSGYEVVVADDGPAALAIFAQRRHEIALVLTDFLMPQMTGVALARVVRKMNPAAKVILSTGRDQDCGPKELSSIGIAAALTKPYTQVTLLRTIDRVLHGTGVLDQ